MTFMITGKAMQTTDNVCDPPLAESYQALLYDPKMVQKYPYNQDHEVIRECELPLIDLSGLRSSDGEERRACMEAIAKASSEWGFFQVLKSHGISNELLGEMRREQLKLFRLPFDKKVSSGLLNDSYRWGNPTAISPKQFSWSEACHVPLAKISDENCCYGKFCSPREIMEKIAAAINVGACSRTSWCASQEFGVQQAWISRKLQQEDMLPSPESISPMSLLAKSLRFDASHRQRLPHHPLSRSGWRTAIDGGF